MADLFDRLRPPAPKKTQEIPPAQKLLTWLQTWRKPIITARDIRLHGPRAVRNSRKALESAQILAKFGHLTPLEESARRNWRAAPQWRIVRNPAVVYPTITSG
jgi:hypothetical protein